MTIRVGWACAQAMRETAGSAAAPAARCRNCLRWGSFMASLSERRDASFCLDVRRPDHLAPLLGFLGDQLAEVGGQAGKNRAAQAGKLCLELGVGEARVNFLVELVNNLRRCVLGRADAIPLARLEARQEFSHSWDARQRLRARRGRYR